MPTLEELEATADCLKAQIRWHLSNIANSSQIQRNLAAQRATVDKLLVEIAREEESLENGPEIILGLRDRLVILNQKIKVERNAKNIQKLLKIASHIQGLEEEVDSV